MEEKIPRFFTKPRREKVSLWVEMDGHPPNNIWDLTEKEMTPDVMDAIRMAFVRGVEFSMLEANRRIASCIYVPYDIKWEERK